MKTGLIIAVRDEAAAILADVWYGWKESGDDIWESPRGVTLAVSGIGKAYAVHALGRVAGAADRILIMGTSGGLGTQEIGAVFVTGVFHEHDMDVTGLGFPAGVTPFSTMKESRIDGASESYLESLRAAAVRAGIEPREGSIISGDQFICSREVNDAKRDLFAADLVDMESAAIAKICATKLDTQVAAVRYVTDNANHEAAGHWQENVARSAVVFNAILKEYLSR